jgi:hypothetical protein
MKIYPTVDMEFGAQNGEGLSRRLAELDRQSSGKAHEGAR